MKVEEFIKWVNGLNVYNLYEVEDEVKYNKIDVEKVADEFDYDNRRWYSLATIVYKCDDGFVGVRGACMLHSEEMSYSDAGVVTKAFEVIPQTVTSYVRK